MGDRPAPAPGFDFLRPVAENPSRHERAAEATWGTAAAPAPGRAMMGSQPILVLTNDDGVDAPGMRALQQATAGLGQCRVIAPCGPISGCGHQVTTHAPIQISHRARD